MTSAFSWGVVPVGQTRTFDPADPFQLNLGAALTLRYEPAPGVILSGNIQQMFLRGSGKDEIKFRFDDAGRVYESSRVFEGVIPTMERRLLLSAGSPAIATGEAPPPRVSWWQVWRVYLEPASRRMLARGFSAGLPFLLVLAQLLGVPLLIVRQKDGSALLRQIFGIAALVVVDGVRQWHEKRRQTGCGQFADSQRTGAANHQIGLGKCTGRVVDKGHQLGIHTS